MNNRSDVYIARALSGVHAGGVAGNLFADFTIQKEAKEGIPKIDSATWKGSIYAMLREYKNNGNLDITFSDLKLLFFPVRAHNQPFVLVTSPIQLREFANLLKVHDIENKDRLLLIIETILKEKNKLRKKNIISKQKQSFLSIAGYAYEVDQFESATMQALEQLAQILEQPLERLVLINHMDFVDMVKDELEYVTRVQIGKNKVSVDENLFVEEYLPEETILYGFITKFKSLQQEQQEEKLLQKIPSVIQIGKNRMLGKGMIQLTRWEE